ncbi:sensor histidine kinase [Microbacterium allomyrinae]|uniref:histidine kinase n=1 Tax=Microbacterium allomyrinae TaxID=2830666 RepID=A0A9X1LX46_9MICO|nr:histidine kinase [Microbacterium allomyrinae]MCC2033263.1 sensor histidine kinase [Microbacterium allomyrinae]
MMSPVRALWDAPAAIPAPPRRVWRDGVLIAAVALLAPLEAALRPEVPWRWLWAVVLVGLSPTLLWRRARPFTMLAIAFGTGTIVGLLAGGDSQLFTTAYLLILLYALFRWGRGRALIAGGMLVAIGIVVSAFTPPLTPGDTVGGIAVAVATSTLGVAFRWRSRARARELDQVRLIERAQLARDLHDTVAHHVSAIAIQAQAGTAVAATDPAATAGVLRAIEGEATRTLREMRSMVGLLRADAPDLAPTPVLADLLRLREDEPAGPPVSIRLDGNVDSVPPAVAAAVFRLAQEAVTNARRHARNAHRIDVAVQVDGSGVRLAVRDDGEQTGSAPTGYGVRGMKERAALLGGSCESGPIAGGGWLVAASLPRAGWTT